MPSRRCFLLNAAAAAPALGLPAAFALQTPLLAQGPRPVNTPDTAKLPAPIQALQDRTAEIKAISPREREERLDRARSVMKANKIDAIVITTGASLYYFTGARWGQSERLFAYVLPVAAAPFAICPALERDRFAELLTHFPERESTLTYFWEENDNPYIILRKALAQDAITTGTLGIEEHTQFAFSQGIADACPALKLVSATPVTAGCRAIKTPAELALLQLANNITLDVYRAVYLACKPGDTNQTVSDLVARAYTRCGVRGDASCNVGPDSAIPHGSNKPQTIAEGQIVMVDDGCTVEGYTSDITRSWVYGTPTDEQRKIFDIVHQAQSAALAAARPGVQAQSVDAAARKVIVDAGYGPGYSIFYHRVGHGIGLDMHEWPYLVGDNIAPLQAGETFSDEPGIYLRGKFGIRLEDCMYVTADSAKLFTPQSRSLEHPFG